MIRFGSLFTGIGGCDIGFERSGMACSWQVENDLYAISVLEKHWPHVRRWDDVCTFPPEPSTDWSVDVICGGFPCQDISSANYRGKGIEGERSGLWSHFARAIRILRPRFAVLENVPALTFRGLGTVLRDLAEIGYDAEWDTLSANQFGAPHQRDRIFIVAYPTGIGRQANGFFSRSPYEAASEKQASRLRNWPGRIEYGGALPNRVRWCPDSSLCRVVNELPDRLDRYRVVGNAIVPEVAFWLGRRIVEAMS